MMLIYFSSEYRSIINWYESLHKLIPLCERCWLTLQQTCRGQVRWGVRSIIDNHCMQRSVCAVAVSSHCMQNLPAKVYTWCLLMPELPLKTSVTTSHLACITRFMLHVYATAVPGRCVRNAIVDKSYTFNRISFPTMPLCGSLNGI